MEHSVNCTNQGPSPTPHRVEPDFYVSVGAGSQTAVLVHNCENSDGWRGTNMSDDESFDYHYAKHGAGMSPEDYASAARAWAANPAGEATPVDFADGSQGLRFRTPGGGPGGILDTAGKIISFWTS